jgi:hypothetical protein
MHDLNLIMAHINNVRSSYCNPIFNFLSIMIVNCQNRSLKIELLREVQMKICLAETLITS